MGDAIKALSDWAFLISVTIFGLSALVLNFLLYGSRLVPRLISTWGLAASLLFLTGSVLAILDVFSGAAFESIIAAPIAIQEMALAGWLIVKGFRAEAIAAAAT